MKVTGDTNANTLIVKGKIGVFRQPLTPYRLELTLKEFSFSMRTCACLLLPPTSVDWFVAHRISYYQKALSNYSLHDAPLRKETSTNKQHKSFLQTDVQKGP